MAVPRQRPRAGARHLCLLCHFAAAWRPLRALQIPGRGPGSPENVGLGVQDSTAQDGSLLEKAAKHAEVILARFDMVDSDYNGIVTLEEIRAGYSHKDSAPERHAEQLFLRMLAACNGGLWAHRSVGEVLSCTRQQMEASLAMWTVSLQALKSMRTLWSETQTSFVELEDSSASKPCGAALGTDPPEVNCTWRGPMCWAGDDPLMSWFLLHICSTGGCICGPTRKTMRVAKLGLMGAVAVAGTADFSDPDEWRSEPSCGDGWEGVWKTQRLTGLNRRLSASDMGIMRVLAESMAPDRVASILAVDSTEASFALWKNKGHRLLKEGPEEQVCMLSWQSSFSDGDWKLNFMLREVSFPYGPEFMNTTMPLGLVLAYKKARELAKKTFQDSCCTETFRAKRLILSGHSHGAALAEMTAVDAITSWNCGEEKLTADHISVVLVAPDPAIVSMKAINAIWSCQSRTACLAGSAITMINDRDPIAAGAIDPISRLPLHPSRPVQLPCRQVPADMKLTVSKSQYRLGHCHDLENYVENVEDLLVDEQSWGSTCGGHCGNPNRQLQCYHFHTSMLKSCKWAEPGQLGVPTPCSGMEAWQAEKEKCVCPLDRCDRLITAGCK